MKIRNGFVSNSSSMSSIVFPKDTGVLLNKEDPVFEGGWNSLFLDVVDEDYSRGRNEILTTIEDKLRFYISMCALYYTPDNYETKIQEESDKSLRDYFNNMDEIVKRVHKLAKKYDLHLHLSYPPVHSYIDSDYDYDDKKFIPNGIKKYSINISTENCFYSEVDKFDDTTLEKFLFDRRSFAIVGGDEYLECYDNEWKMKQTIDYEYERIADYNDHKKGERYGDGPNDVWEYDSSWGERIPDYYDTDHIPEYDKWEDRYDGGQPNLPFNPDYKEDII